MSNKIIVTLVDDAFLDDDGNYTALATLSKNDIENTEDATSEFPESYAKVHWNTLDSWDGEDGGDACDWSAPEGVKLGDWIADKKTGINDFSGFDFIYINTDGSSL